MVLIALLAGRGKRFADAHYKDPKPFIEVMDRPMLFQVIKNCLTIQMKKVLFLCLEDHAERLHDLLQVFQQNYPWEIITIPAITQGAAETVLASMHYVSEQEEIMIVNSDQILDWNAEHFIKYVRRHQADVAVPTFMATGNKWSYAAVEVDGTITSIAEKCPISCFGTCGLYYWRKAGDCYNAIVKMIQKNTRTNGEFYLAPSINENLLSGQRVLNYQVPFMWGLGTPEDLQRALADPYFKDYLGG